MIFTSIVILLVIGGLSAFMQHPKFGGKPSVKEFKRLETSNNYKNGQFQNLSNTPQLTGDGSMFKIMKKFFFNKDKGNTPPFILPSKKTNLFELNVKDDVIVWFGHSSYFMQLAGKTFLVDPVFSGHASPVRFTTKSFKGSDVYKAEDIPPIDFLLITHDHYDHLDYETIIRLRPKIRTVITGLGVGGHFKRWGYDEKIIFEKDWNEQIKFDELTFITTTARHFSGRSFKRNSSLWLSFVVITPTKKIFVGGDSGYDSHFKTIGEKFGPFDLVILENGQYNQYWKYIHMMPEEVVQAAMDLKGKKLLPVHWGKFSLSLHAWDEPIRLTMDEAKRKNLEVLHPMIGEAVALDENSALTKWWDL
jgi:L-ascorbate metabolism protein UlaG (beta-lactamase superfamily)